MATSGTQGQQRESRLPGLCPELGEPQFPALLLAGDSCRNSFTRAGKPPAWSPSRCQHLVPTVPGEGQGTRILHWGAAATTSALEPGLQEHHRVPSWGRQCNHRQKGNTFHQRHHGPQRHDQFWVLKRSREMKSWDKNPKTKPKQRCRIVSADLKLHPCGLYRA